MKGTPIRLNRNFANDTFRIWPDNDGNGWCVLIGSVTGWKHCKFIICLNDYVGWNKKQFQYCVEFRDENIMDNFLQQIDHENMFGKVVSTIDNRNEDQWERVDRIDVLKKQLPSECYGKPLKELWATPQSTWFYYFIQDSSEWVVEGREDANDALIDRIVEFYAAIGGALSKKNNDTKPDGNGDTPKKNKKSDPEKNAMVEKAAIIETTKHFKKKGYAVYSVEKDNVGWDLEANYKKKKLRIEVKGLSGKNIAVGLTPNEYEAFDKNSDDYRLCIVYSALNEPKLLVCRYSEESSEWVVEGREDVKCKVKPKQSATVNIDIPHRSVSIEEDREQNRTVKPLSTTIDVVEKPSEARKIRKAKPTSKIPKAKPTSKVPKAKPTSKIKEV